MRWKQNERIRMLSENCLWKSRSLRTPNISSVMQATFIAIKYSGSLCPLAKPSTDRYITNGKRQHNSLSDVTWALRRPISQATRLFDQEVIQANGKETIKALHYRLSPRTQTRNAECVPMVWCHHSWTAVKSNYFENFTNKFEILCRGCLNHKLRMKYP